MDLEKIKHEIQKRWFKTMSDKSFEELLDYIDLAYDLGLSEGETIGYKNAMSEDRPAFDEIDTEEMEDASYHDGLEDGRQEGYDSGFEDGHQSAIDEMQERIWQEGYDEGFENGKEKGYDEGHEIGVNEGIAEGIEQCS